MCYFAPLTAVNSDRDSKQFRYRNWSLSSRAALLSRLLSRAALLSRLLSRAALIVPLIVPGSNSDIRIGAYCPDQLIG